GVTLKSPKNLSLNADDDIIIKTPASVKVKAQSQIGVIKTGTESGFSVETDMHFKGSNVIKDGSDRETYAPFDDEPKAGKKPDPPAPPPEKKKGFNWGKLALAAVVAVAVVASVATFGLGATLAVAAVGAIVACAAAGAVEGAKNSIASQTAQNGGDSSKINYFEVAKASFFGAVTGAKDMAETEACAAYDTLDQTASFMFDVCTLGAFHDSCKDFSEWSHKFFMDKAPYKEGFEDSEFVINTALLADGMFSIGNMARNLPKKFSIGQFSLEGIGVNIPVVCADGSIVLAAPGDLASMGGAGSAMYNMSKSNDAGESNEGEDKSKTLVEKGEQFTNGRKNKLKPDIRYKAGEFDYYYETDSSGRLTKFETDDLQFTEREERLSNSKNTPGKIKGKDHAGHLAGDRFGGSPKIDNLVSQLSEVNLSEYKKIENLWAEAISSGQNVTVDMDIVYEGSSLRPSEFIVNYTIDGEAFSVPIKN
ncbi:DNA/RNA non-specific endonuclease, partial [Clostridium sp.]|uniref:DNA/RNA non-specific endonuclease n=1 Tax=Clostridium sp. TaxID=1506 RepID=UPI002632C734